MLRIQGGWTILSYISFLLGLTVIADFKYHVCDFLVCFFIIYSIFSYFLFGDYPVEVFIASIRDQIFPISFYFFARSKHMRNCDLLQKAIIPLMVAYFVGFVLFFTAPGWYIDYRLGGDYNRTVNGFYEVTRLSSFWTSSYFVGFSALFVIIYVINRRFIDNYVVKNYKTILVISFLTLFFTQQRISIGFVGLYLIILSLTLIFKGRLKPITFIKYFLSACLLIGIIAILVTFYTDKYYVDYIVGRVTGSEDGMIEDRVNLFEKYISSISFWGDGMGKYSHNALLYDLPSITDCEYIRTPNEIGIFGMILFLLIALLSFLRLIKKRKILCFESFCLAFFLLAMIGATPLEVSQQQPFMLWYCIGKIQNYG